MEGGILRVGPSFGLKKGIVYSGVVVYLCLVSALIYLNVCVCVRANAHAPTLVGHTQYDSLYESVC